ncbi:MAG: DUF374 domain-containing protein [Rhodospirillales bacterium]|nr:MAG: DUF374 domain-containing protein [Rhodospirillales bacterium]
MLARSGTRAWLSRIAAAYLRLVYATGRWSVLGVDAVDRHCRSGRPFIACFWHGRMLLMPYASWCWPCRFRMLISRHRDGRIIAETIQRLGTDTVAGSSSRGGAEAVRELIAALAAGDSIGITPDGPRGPRMRAQMGAIRLARWSGAPVVPVSFSARRRKVLSSWDRFIVIFPFGRGVLAYGEPIWVPADAGVEELEGLRSLLERRMNDLTAEVDRMTGHTPILPAPAKAPAAASAAETELATEAKSA